MSPPVGERAMNIKYFYIIIILLFLALTYFYDKKEPLKIKVKDVNMMFSYVLSLCCQ